MKKNLFITLISLLLFGLTNAQVISTPLDSTISHADYPCCGNANIDLDVDGDATNDLRLNIDSILIGQAQLTVTILDSNITLAYDTTRYFGNWKYDSIATLVSGDSVNSNLFSNNLIHQDSGQFAFLYNEHLNNYFGFRLNIAGNEHFGFVNFSIYDDTLGLTVHGYGYESTANTPIKLSDSLFTDTVDECDMIIESNTNIPFGDTACFDVSHVSGFHFWSWDVYNATFAGYPDGTQINTLTSSICISQASLGIPDSSLPASFDLVVWDPFASGGPCPYSDTVHITFEPEDLCDNIISEEEVTLLSEDTACFDISQTSGSHFWSWEIYNSTIPGYPDGTQVDVLKSVVCITQASLGFPDSSLPGSFDLVVWDPFASGGECSYSDTVHIIVKPMPHLYGQIYSDINKNCIKDSAENGLKSWGIKVNDIITTVTNDSGFYKLLIEDSVNYKISPVIPNHLKPWVNAICPPFYEMYMDESNVQDTFNFNFGIDATECPMLTIDIGSQRRRRCFKNTTYVEYCNDGFADASNVQVTVEFPQYVRFISANYEHSINELGNYVFDIGNLSQGECGTIEIIDSVACEDSITGLTQCTKAWIGPSNALCMGLASNWDKSHLDITTICGANNAIYFIVKNNGEGDMSSVEQVRLYTNGGLFYTNNIQLTAGDSTIFLMYNSIGATLRMEADQTAGHPTEQTTYVNVTDCGTNQINYGYVTQMSQFDESTEIEEECLPIIDSYVSNDKQVFPSGLTSSKYVEPGTTLEYKISFMNTGTDTAYNVTIIDTLSKNLDPTTIQWGATTHDYTIDISGTGQTVLNFHFNNINLVDSATNVTESQGFLKFKIAPLDSLANGTEVHNTADILFDFNAPISTGDSWVTIYDTTITGPPLTVTILDSIGTGLNENLIMQQLKIVPNPFSRLLKIKLPENMNSKFITTKMKDMTGRVVNVTQTGSSQSNQIDMDGSCLKKGVYLIEIYDNENLIGRLKVIKQ